MDISDNSDEEVYFFASVENVDEMNDNVDIQDNNVQHRNNDDVKISVSGNYVSEKIEEPRRISIIQFLRDRELGLRGINECGVRENAKISKYIGPKNWPHDLAKKQSDQIVEDACRVVNGDVILYSKLEEPIIHRVEKFLYNCRIQCFYIKIPAGNGLFTDIALFHDIHLHRDLWNARMPILKIVRHDKCELCGYYRESLTNAIIETYIPRDYTIRVQRYKRCAYEKSPVRDY